MNKPGNVSILPPFCLIFGDPGKADAVYLTQGAAEQLSVSGGVKLTSIRFPSGAVIVGTDGSISLVPSGTGVIRTIDIRNLGGLELTALDTPENEAFEDLPDEGDLDADTEYFYRVSATNGHGETLASDETSITTDDDDSNTHQVVVKWGLVAGATGYKVYGRSTGAEELLATIDSGATLAWTDDGSETPDGAPPTLNSTAPVMLAGPLVFANDVQIHAGSSDSAAEVLAEVGVGGELGSLYLSSGGKMYLKVANNEEAADWELVTTAAEE